MSSASLISGRLDSTQVHTEGRIPFEAFSTWYRIYGGPGQPGKLPLLCLHGGPGGTCWDILPLRSMAATGRQVIFYDQLGCGHSALPEPHPELWSIELFVREIDAIRQALELSRIHLFGHSWGGMLALSYMLTHPSGVASLTLAGAPARFADVIAETYRGLDELAPAFGRIVREHEATGTCDDPEYLEACQAWFERFVAARRARPAEPDEDDFRGSHEVNRALTGPVDFDVQGPLRDWDVTDRLAEITTPTLITSGRFDLMTERIERPLREGIRGSTWVVFEESAHMAHLDEPERYREVLSEFLSRHEP